MAKIIKLPSGITIDMEQGEIRTNLGPGPVSINHSRQRYTGQLSLWGRFDSFIARIGDWFADYSATIISVMSILLVIAIAIPFVLWLISLGWFWGIVAGLCLSTIVYYAAMIVVGIFIWVSNIVLGIIRYVFYSGKTFLITLAVLGTITGAGVLVSAFYTPDEEQTETVQRAAATTRYNCTAKSSLRVRSAPNAKAKVVGSLKPGQPVDVYEITNGFARIKYNGKDAYASTKYLKRNKDKINGGIRKATKE